jgi:hypothetical protein
VTVRRHDDQVGLLTVDLVDKCVVSVPWASMVSGLVGTHEDKVCLGCRRQIRRIPQRTFGACRAIPWKNDASQHSGCPFYTGTRRWANRLMMVNMGSLQVLVLAFSVARKHEDHVSGK